MNALPGIVVQQVPVDQRGIAWSFLQNAPRSGCAPQFSEEYQSGSTLFWACRECEILGVGYVPQPVGGLAHLIPPQMVTDGDENVPQGLLRCMLEYLSRRGDARLVQSLALLHDERWPGTLKQLAFREIATIDLLGGLPQTKPFESDVRLEPSTGRDQRLKRIVSATWEGSRDCTELDDPRSVDDVLAEYAMRCSEDFSHWYIARRSREDAGCLIMDRTRDGSSLDIVYWGVAPSSRGCGLGDQILRSAREIAAAEGCILTAVVDRANSPAVRAYRSAGFTVVDSQRLFVRHIESSESLESTSTDRAQPPTS